MFCPPPHIFSGHPTGSRYTLFIFLGGKGRGTRWVYCLVQKHNKISQLRLVNRSNDPHPQVPRASRVSCSFKGMIFTVFQLYLPGGGHPNTEARMHACSTNVKGWNRIFLAAVVILISLMTIFVGSVLPVKFWKGKWYRRNGPLDFCLLEIALCSRFLLRSVSLFT